MRPISFSGLIRPAGALWAALAAVCLVSGCSDQAKVNRHASRADAYFAEGDFDKARIEYLNIVRLEPTNTHAITRLGHIFFESGVVLQAGMAYQQALQLGATDPRLHARLGVLLAASNRPEEARQSARKALESDPAQEDAIVLLADLANNADTINDFLAQLTQLRSRQGNLPIYDAAEAAVALKQRDAAKASELAQKAVAAGPDSAAAQFILAGVLFAQTNLVAGETALARAAELSPARSTRQIRYVNYLFQKGATNEARAALDKLVKTAPDFIPARLRQAQVAFAEKDYGSVAGEINAVLTRDPLNIEARQLEAQMHLAKQEPAKAMEIMDQLVKHYTNSPQLYYQAAVVSLANQNPARAQALVDHAYELNPAHVESTLLRGRLYLARGQAGEVVSSVQRLIATNANVRPAYQMLGAALAASGETNRALAVYRDMARRFPTDPAAPQLAGVLLLQQKKPAEARAEFEKALALRPDHLPALEQLVALDLQENRAEAAADRTRKFLEQHPGLVEARLLLAQALLAGKQPELAEQELEQLIEARPLMEQPYLLLADVYLKTSRIDEALARLGELIEKKPGESRALMMLGLLHTQKQDYQAAARRYEELLKASASFVPALNNLAYIYSEKLNQLDRAYELARKSRDLQPDDPRVADTIGWIFFLRREYAQALVYLEESAAKLPRVAEVQYHLGMAHYAMAHEAQARAAFQNALALDPQAAWNDTIREQLAILDANPGDPETLKRLEQLADQRKDDVLLLARLGLVQETARQFDQALATYRRAAAASPEAAAPLIGQARVAAAKGDAGEALSIARKAHGLAGNDPAAAYELGRVAYLARDHVWSYSLLQDAASRLSGSPQVQFAFAQTAIAVGRLDAARTALEKAQGAPAAERAALQLKLIPHCLASTVDNLPADLRQQIQAPAQPELLADFLKARLQAAEGKPDDAMKALDQLLTAYPQFTPAKRTLAIISIGQPGSAGQAEKLARAVREAQPNDAEMARVLGQAALARKDFRYAADMLQEASRALANDGELFLLLGEARAGARQVAEARQALNRALALPLSDPRKAHARQLLEQLKE